MSFKLCPFCQGNRLQPEALAVTIKGKSISEIAKSSIANIINFISKLSLDEKEQLVAAPILMQIKQRLRFLVEVGLGYLTLDRRSDTLAGGEAQRIKLAKELSKPSTGKTLYILDEPTTGLHFADILAMTPQILDNLESRRRASWQTLNFINVIFNVYSKKEACKILKFVWEKPVIVFYRERLKKPERKAFAVVKARRLVISRVEGGTKFRGNIKDFFPFMGDIDYISSTKGMSDRYVLCWIDDKEDDFSKAWRRLNGVNFPSGIVFRTDEKGKRTYNADFEAEHGKLD